MDITNKQKAAALSIISNTILIIFKLSAGLLMNSVSVISEAIHSSIDLLASLIAFFSIKKASLSVDKDHPFGHGKYENVSGFIEALLILLAAIIIGYQSISKIISGTTIKDTLPGIIVMLVASAINFIISRILLKASKKTGSIALEADAMHLLTDVYTSLGVFAGLMLVRFTGIKIIDPIAAILVAILIGRTSIELIKKSMVDLVDSALPEKDVHIILSVILSHSEVKAYHRLRTRQTGLTKEVDIHLKLDKDLPLYRAHEVSRRIEGELAEALPHSYITIHEEPYYPPNVDLPAK
jgi:cation diffusion facilitator family transporter